MDPFGGAYLSHFRFAKLFVTHEISIMRLTADFMQNYHHPRPSWVTLSTWDGRMWPMRIIEIGGRGMIETGWVPFMEAYHLETGDQLYFAYDRGSHIHVSIFDALGTLKDETKPAVVPGHDVIIVEAASPDGGLQAGVEGSLGQPPHYQLGSGSHRTSSDSTSRGSLGQPPEYQLGSENHKTSPDSTSKGIKGCRSCTKRGKNLCMCRVAGKRKRDQAPSYSDEDNSVLGSNWEWPSSGGSPSVMRDAGTPVSDEIVIPGTTPCAGVQMPDVSLIPSPRIVQTQNPPTQGFFGLDEILFSVTKPRIDVLMPDVRISADAINVISEDPPTLVMTDEIAADPQIPIPEEDMVTQDPGTRVSAAAGTSDVALDVYCRGEIDHFTGTHQIGNGEPCIKQDTTLASILVRQENKKKCCCYIQMKEAFVSGHYELVIPRLFANANLTEGVNDIKLTVGPDKEKNWTIYLVFRDGKAKTVYGFEKFAAEWNLKEGDMCKFQTMRNKRGSWKVTVFNQRSV